MLHCHIPRRHRREAMSIETIAQWGKFSRAALDSFKELTAINAKLVERLSEQQLELVGLTLEASIKGANLAVGVPAYKEFVSCLSERAGDYNDKLSIPTRRLP